MSTLFPLFFTVIAALWRHGEEAIAAIFPVDLLWMILRLSKTPVHPVPACLVFRFRSSYFLVTVNASRRFRFACGRVTMLTHTHHQRHHDFVLRSKPR
ncbi:hypothetical protein B0H66DRAFT_550021 [Apodospora peruviana]|uniref:Secreted protein n=1 Tax=Apodospora peruviana TaxID=516989 RepID=A0AAE0IJ46_9PEZI|nr:hypothetical protein B0H66DRAFT_550021 [Apodospora peruviana]